MICSQLLTKQCFEERNFDRRGGKHEDKDNNNDERICRKEGIGTIFICQMLEQTKIRIIHQIAR